MLTNKSVGEHGYCGYCGINYPAGLVRHHGKLACPVCDASMHLESLASYNPGFFIYLPEVDQVTINKIVAGSFALRSSSNPQWIAAGVAAYESLLHFHEVIRSELQLDKSPIGKNHIQLFISYLSHKGFVQHIRFVPRYGLLRTFFEQLHKLKGFTDSLCTSSLVTEMINFNNQRKIMASRPTTENAAMS